MMPPRHKNDIMIGWCHGFIEAQVIGKDTLDTEPVRRIEPVAIGLFKIGDLGKGVLVMSVRRISRPVPCGSKHFDHQQAVGHVAIFHRDIVDETCIGAGAALCQFDPLGPQHLRGLPTGAGCAAKRKHAWRRGTRLPYSVRRNIQSMRRQTFEDRQPRARQADLRPVHRASTAKHT